MHFSHSNYWLSSLGRPPLLKGSLSKGSIAVLISSDRSLYLKTAPCCSTFSLRVLLPPCCTWLSFRLMVRHVLCHVCWWPLLKPCRERWAFIFFLLETTANIKVSQSYWTHFSCLVVVPPIVPDEIIVGVSTWRNYMALISILLTQCTFKVLIFVIVVIVVTKLIHWFCTMSCLP